MERIERISTRNEPDLFTNSLLDLIKDLKVKDKNLETIS